MQTLSVGWGEGGAAGRFHEFGPLDIGHEHVPAFDANVLRRGSPRAPVVLGADFLREHKVWLSYSRGEVRVASDW